MEKKLSTNKDEHLAKRKTSRSSLGKRTKSSAEEIPPPRPTRSSGARSSQANQSSVVTRSQSLSSTPPNSPPAQKRSRRSSASLRTSPSPPPADPTPTHSRKTRKPNMSATGSEHSPNATTEADKAKDTSQEDKTNLDTDMQNRNDSNDNDDDGNDDGDPLHPSSALQNLLRRLGGGMMFEGMVPPGALSSTRLQTMARGLQSGDPDQIAVTLNELCDLLSVANEENISSSGTEALVPALVPILGMDMAPETELLAARALSNLMEAAPGSSSLVARCGAAPLLCSKLLSIEFIDLAEESLRAIEKLSAEHADVLLECNAIMAVLAYVDFFSTAVQRSALQTVANLCQHVTQSHLSSVRENVPQLATFLTYSDLKTVELACLSFEKLTTHFKDNSQSLQQILNPQAVKAFVDLIQRCTRDQMSAQVHTSVMQTLAVAVKSHDLERACLEGGIIECLRSALSADLASSSLEVDGGHVSHHNVRSASQMHEVLMLTSELMPALPEATPSTSSSASSAPATSSPSSSSKKRSATTRFQRKQAKKSTPGSPDSDPTASPPNPDPATRSHALTGDTEMLSKYSHQLLELLLQVYDHHINTKVRAMCLVIVSKVVFYCSGDMLVSSVSPLRFSAFVSELLCAMDAEVVHDGLKIASQLVQKLSSTFTHVFRRQGIANHCQRLATRQSPWQWERGLTSSSPANLFGVLLRPPLSSAQSHDSVSSASAPRDPVDHPGFAQCPTALKKKIETLSQSLVDNYFPPAGEDDSRVLDSLRAVASVLSSTPATEPPNPQADQQALKDLHAVLTSASGVSVFELMSSGIVPALLAYLNHTNSSVDALNVMFQRIKSLVEVGDRGDETQEPVSLLLVLVRNLQQTLAQVEQFPLCLHNQSSAAGDSLADIKVLAQPFKLRLQRVSGDTLVKEHSSSVVLIESLATINAVEDYLLPKVSLVPTPSSRPAENSRLELDDLALTEPSDSQGSKTAQERSLLQERQRRSMEELPSSQTKPDSEKANDNMGDDGDGDDDDDDGDGDDGDGDDNDSEIERQLRSMQQLMDQTDSPSVIDVPLTAMTPASSLSSPPARQILPSPSLATPNASRTPSTPIAPRPSPAPSTTPGPAQPAAEDTAEHNLLFFYEGKRLNYRMSIFQVLHNHAISQTQGDTSLQSLWQQVHTITYCSVNSNVPEKHFPRLHDDSLLTPPAVCHIDTSQRDLPAAAALARLVPRPTTWPNMRIDATTSLLHLLRVLHGVAMNWRAVTEPNNGLTLPLVPATEFVSARLTTKLARQLDDPLSICSEFVPKWCDALPVMCPFLFGFDTRSHRLISRAFGTARSLHAFQNRHQQSTQTVASGVRVARIQRQKARIHRTKIVESAIKVMSLYANSKAMLEIEYYDEVGTGTGPTMEFYSLVADKLREKSMGLWLDRPKDSNIHQQFVENDLGLYPRPISVPSPKTLEMFRFMGQLIGKAMMDSRLVELPLSEVFIKLVVGEEVYMHDLFNVAPEIAQTITDLSQLCEEKRIIESLDEDEASKQERIAALRLFGSPVEDLCLAFALPSDPSHHLMEGGADTIVTLDNAPQYIATVLDALLGKGVVAQVQAFREGFSCVFSVSHLVVFTPREIEILICGEHKQLSLQTLRQHTKTDHGYNSASTVVQMLFEVIDEMDAAEQRRFVMFVTGSPRLPAGGLANLTPRLTIVRKTPDPGFSPDTYLPSVMTCANYLKLPEYSSKDVMRERLHVAISDGQGSFHLS